MNHLSVTLKGKQYEIEYNKCSNTYLLSFTDPELQLYFGKSLTITDQGMLNRATAIPEKEGVGFDEIAWELLSQMRKAENTRLTDDDGNVVTP